MFTALAAYGNIIPRYLTWYTQPAGLKNNSHNVGGPGWFTENGQKRRTLCLFIRLRYANAVTGRWCRASLWAPGRRLTYAPLCAVNDSTQRTQRKP